MNVKKVPGAPVLILSAIFFMIAAAGCAAQKTPESPRAGTYEFTDSCGRKVELPKDIRRVAPSGPLAQIVLYTLCPDKLAGFGIDFSDKQFEYIDRKYASLPVLGNFYGDTLNLESLMVADPQIVIDVGEPMKKIREDMDGIQKKTGIPTIFVKMDMDSMVSAYKTLGEVVGETGQARKIIDYIEKTFSETRQKLELVPVSGRVKLYYGQYDNGLTAVVKGTVHADVIDIAGGINVSEVEESIRGGASEISMEQLMLWNPDVVLFAPDSIYGSVESRAEWKEISAIKNRKYYEVPNGPYNWMGRPPSVNRVLGVRWLSNLLYPAVFPYDMVKETREFYRLFYHCDVTDEQIGALLSRSTYRNDRQRK